ncbi:MAG: ABC transporter, partial [Devosia sp.]|nr:ABC transporter [Devosia sp.]
MKSTTRSTTGAAPTGRLGSKGEALKTGQRDIKPIRRLMPFVLRYPWRLTFTIGFLLVSTLSSLVIPSLAGKIIDKGFVEQNLSMVGQYGMIAIGVALVMALASAGRFYFISVLGERVLTDL